MTTAKSTLRAASIFSARCLALVVLVFGALAGTASAQWTTSGNDIYSSNSGNVGIGTTSPTQKLEVNGAVMSTGSIASFAPVDRTTSGLASFYRTGGITRFWDSTFGDVFSFNTSGNVGIGTTSPSTKLDVNGNVSITGDITVNGNISAKYQDLAEWVPAAVPIAAGSVVIVDPSGTNTVLTSNRAYDTRIAGVVSEQPGIVLGEGGGDKVKVATTGRVKVRVDATRLPIQPGDLLVSSGKEGVAMKSEPVTFGGIEIHRPGTLIGKALEPLVEGEGEILVLLSLQ